MIKAGIITISDRGFRGERDDTSGEVVGQELAKFPAEICAYEIVPDEEDRIIEAICRLADKLHLDLIITTGGTGLSPRDVTPEATRKVLERDIPGLAEAMRYAGSLHTPFSYLSRALAGIRGQSLIINLPGSPRAVKENLATIFPLLPHALVKIKGDQADCAR